MGASCFEFFLKLAYFDFMMNRLEVVWLPRRCVIGKELADVDVWATVSRDRVLEADLNETSHDFRRERKLSAFSQNKYIAFKEDMQREHGSFRRYWKKVL
jgi:hypothetical protein